MQSAKWGFEDQDADPSSVLFPPFSKSLIVLTVITRFAILLQATGKVRLEKLKDGVVGIRARSLKPQDAALAVVLLEIAVVTPLVHTSVYVFPICRL